MIPPSVVSLARARAGVEPRAKAPPVDPDRPSITPAAADRTLSYREWFQTIEWMALCLQSRGVRPGDRVLLLSQTRMEWFQADLAIMSAGGLTVPVYPTLPAQEMDEILLHAEPSVAIVSNRALLDELRRAPSASACLRATILMEGAPEAGDNVLAWTQAIETGQQTPREARDHLAALAHNLNPEDAATVIYTSGTSGRMKGVLLTHGNLLAAAVGSARRLGVGPDDVYLSFLPLTHVLERVVHLSMLWAGARVCYGSGLDRLEADFRRARPTIVVGVPRLYEKILRAAEDRARRKGPQARWLFRLAERAARRSGRRGPRSRPGGLTGWLWDAVVYRKIRRALGGRTRFLISGGAPLGTREMHFLNGCGLAVLEGYGLTETSSVVAVTTLDEWRRGSVGRALPGTTIHVAADGEILIRGPSIMRGYWNDDVGTQGALRDGWLHTGDLGRLDGDGYVFVTGRKKDLIVTAQGKNVPPALVEARIRTSPLVQEAVVIGDRRPFLVALVYPDLEMLRARSGLVLPEGPGLQESLQAPGVRAIYRAEIDRVCMGLAPHEKVREFFLPAERPSVADGGLTPTMKLRRAEIERRHVLEIRRMYDQSAR